MRLISVAAIALASLVASTQIGATADLPTKAPPLVAPVAAAQTWTGFYVGLNAGYMWANHDVSSTGTAGPCDPTLIGCTATPNYSTLSAIGSTFSVPVDLKGFIGGGQLGYNWQFTNWVAGLETDLQGIAHHDESGSFFTVVPQPAFPAFPLASAATVSRSLDYLGTVRGRLGWLATPAHTPLRHRRSGLWQGQSVHQHSAGAGLHRVFRGPSQCRWQRVTDFRWLDAWRRPNGCSRHIGPSRARYIYYDLGS